MQKLYGVIGETGEYGDHQWWLVALFPLSTSAQAAKRHLNRAAKAARVGPGQLRTIMKQERRIAAEAYMARAGDIDFRADYTGTTYDVTELPIRAFKNFDEFLKEGAGT